MKDRKKTEGNYVDWYKKALDHYDNGEQTTQALVSINYYLEDNPDNFLGKIVKSMILRSLSNYHASEKILLSIDLKKIKKESSLKTYYHELADLYRAKEMEEEEIKCYDKIMELEPERTNAYILKGSAFARLGKYEEAKKLHLKATTLEGDPDEAYLNLGLILRAELKLEEAKEAFLNALELTPNYEAALIELDDVTAALKLQSEIKADRIAKKK